MNNTRLTKQDLEELLSSNFESTVKVKNFTVTPLTKPGENYGSSMLAVEVELENKENTTLSLVAKLIPESDFLQNMFQCTLTVRKEIDAYCLVRPEYEKIQRECGIERDKILDIFPKCYGARATRNRDVGQPADESAILLLENLKVSGFQTCNRLIGLDLVHAEVAIINLAQFHAVSLAIKIMKPDVFHDTIVKACGDFRLELIGERKFITDLRIDSLRSDSEFDSYIEKIQKAIDGEKDYKPSRGLYATMVHNDFWTNNMLFRYDYSENGVPLKFKKPKELKMVDFQITTYDSAVRDVIFFLYTSVIEEVRINNSAELILLYHKSLTDFLKELKVDTTPFTLKSLRDELQMIAPNELSNIIRMTHVVYRSVDEIPDLTSINLESYLIKDGKNSNAFNKKVLSIVTEFVKNDAKEEWC